MNDSIIRILILLIGHLKDNELNSESLSDFSEGLVTRGYSEKEINEAIQWFFEKLNTRTIMSTDIIEQKTESVRILHDYERMNVPKEVYGYLLKLKSTSVITGSQMEKIIDYCVLSGFDPSEDIDISEIIAGVLFEE